MKRNGLVLKNVLSMLLAIIGLLIFIGGIYKLYQVGLDEESENAKKTLDIVLARVDAMPEGVNGTFTVQGFSEENVWYLSGWNASDREKPEKCFDSSCICVCEGSALAKDCQDNGFCRKVDFTELKLYTEPLSFIFGSLDAQEKSKTYSPRCIIVHPSLSEISVYRQDKTLMIFAKGEEDRESGNKYLKCLSV